jgi:hypothetical protein
LRKNAHQLEEANGKTENEINSSREKFKERYSEMLSVFELLGITT